MNYQKETIQPASNASMPPQFTDPKHQMYEGLLPIKDFDVNSSKPVNVLPNLVADSTPGEYKGIKVYPTDSLKAEFITASKRKFKTKSVAQLLELENTKKILVVKDMEELIKMYPTDETLAGKTSIIIGGVPHATIEGKRYIILPKHFAQENGLIVGEIQFPVSPEDDKIPLMRQTEGMIENMIIQNEKTSMVVSSLFIFIAIAVLIYLVRH